MSQPHCRARLTDGSSGMTCLRFARNRAGSKSYRLADAPEERQWPLADSGNVLAPCLILQEEAGRRLNHVVERSLIEATDRDPLLVERLRLEPGRHLCLNLRDVR